MDGHSLYLFCAHAQLELLEQVAEGFTINQVQHRRTVAGGLTHSLRCERTGSNQETLIGSANHCPAEVPYRRRANTATIALALKEYLEREKRDAQDTNSIDATVTASTGNLYLGEAGLS